MRLSGHQRGAGLIAVIVIIVIFSMLGATLNRMFQASSLAGVEQHTGSDALLVAEAGLQRGVMELTTGVCPPPALTAVTAAGGQYSVTYTLVTGTTNAYWITATGYIPSAANPIWQRTLTQTQTCGGSGGNLFSGSNATYWNHTDLISDGSVTFTSAHSEDEIHSTGHFAIDDPNTGDVYFRTTFSTTATSGVTMQFKVKFHGSDRLWCGVDGTGFPVLTDTTSLTCTRGTIYTTGNSVVDAGNGTISLNLGNFSPTDIEQVDIMVSGLSGGETLTLDDACLAITCPDSSGASAQRSWREL